MTEELEATSTADLSRFQEHIISDQQDADDGGKAEDSHLSEWLASEPKVPSDKVNEYFYV